MDVVKPGARVRIVEIAGCGECPHLDARWEKLPWTCTEGELEIFRKKTVHRDCPLETRREYIERRRV